MLAAEDAAGQAWCKANGYGGYTSYASLDDLPTPRQRLRRAEDAWTATPRPSPRTWISTWKAAG